MGVFAMNYNISNEPVSILIAVPETLYFRNFITYLISMHTIGTLGFAENPNEIIPMALDLQTNVIIVDISLFDNNLTDIIKEIRKVNYKGSIIIILEEYDNSMHTIVNENDHIYFIKRLSNYEELANQIILVSKHGFNEESSSKASVIKEDSEFEFPVELYKEVTMILLNCGFNSKHKGFIYIRESVMLKCVVRDSGSLSKNIYPYIADRYNVSSVSVERAIRSAVSYVWNNSRFEYMAKQGIEYLYSEKPSNAVIINHISDIVKIKGCF